MIKDTAILSEHFLIQQLYIPGPKVSLNSTFMC